MYNPQIEDGDVRMISLNYVKVDDQSLYQTGKESSGTGQEDPPPEEPPAARTIKFIKTKLREGVKK